MPENRVPINPYLGSGIRVLVACEFSGIVRDAFIEAGHMAVSCDLIDTERPGPHVFGNVLRLLEWAEFDLAIMHPPCTHLAVSGARWFKDKLVEQEEALEFVRRLMAAPVPHIALENPVSIISSRIRKPDQIVQPWMFGHGETKATCLWLKDLPKLEPTNLVPGREGRVWYEFARTRSLEEQEPDLRGLRRRNGRSMGTISCRFAGEACSVTQPIGVQALTQCVVPVAGRAVGLASDGLVSRSDAGCKPARSRLSESRWPNRDTPVPRRYPRGERGRGLGELKGARTPAGNVGCPSHVLLHRIGVVTGTTHPSRRLAGRFCVKEDIE